MDSDKITWCKEQNKGIELVEPNDNLCEAYFTESRDTLEMINLDKDNKWNVIMGYYAAYNAFYALLMKAGIKCEIHDCTLELLNLFEEFNSEEYDFLTTLKNKRIKNQYYLKREKLDNFEELKKFIFKCLEIKEDLDISIWRKMLNG